MKKGQKVPLFHRKRSKSKKNEFETECQRQEKSLLPRIQESSMFLLTADRKIDPKIFPGIVELRNHMSNLNEQIMIFHSLTIPAEKMFEKKAVILLGINAIILNGPSSSAIGQ